MAKKTKAKGKRWLKYSIFTLIVIIAIIIIGGWMYLYNHYLHPQRQLNTETPADYGLEFDSIELKTKDNLALACWLIKPPLPLRSESMPTIIALHGYNTNRSDILPRLVELANAGFLIFTYDSRACGDSEGEKITMGAKEFEDLTVTVIPQIKTIEFVNQDKVGIYGFSMGAVLSISAAAENDYIKAVVADSPYARLELITERILGRRGIPSWPYTSLLAFSFQLEFDFDIRSIDPVETVAGISPAPLLLIHGDKDETVPFSHAEMIIAAAKEPKRLVRIPGNGHKDNGSAEIMQKTVIPFFKKSLEVEDKQETIDSPEQEDNTKIKEEVGQDA
jgi:dipeptidyl aminopeptidase/acylaminoacyl peptidase